MAGGCSHLSYSGINQFNFYVIHDLEKSINLELKMQIT